MVKTSGIAWNRLALLINFYSDTVLLIPIHGLCVAGKKRVNTFLLVFVSGFSVLPIPQTAFMTGSDVLCKITRLTKIIIMKFSL